MSARVADFFVMHLQDSVPPEIIVFLISLLPVLELRGGLIAAKLLDIGLAKAFVICCTGNMLPVPFILLFIRRVFSALKKSRFLGGKIEKLEKRSLKKGERVRKYSGWGLLTFVAIPLPGTGAWTGALIAALLDMRLKRSLPIIFAGICISGIIMLILSYGLLGLVI